MLILSNLQNIEIFIKDIFAIISFKHNFYDYFKKQNLLNIQLQDIST